MTGYYLAPTLTLALAWLCSAVASAAPVVRPETDPLQTLPPTHPRLLASPTQRRQQVDGARIEYRLHLDNRDSSKALIDFPLLVSLDESRVNMVDFPSASDLAFYHADGVTRLAHEVDTFDASSVSHVWVRVPEIPANSDQGYILLRSEPTRADSPASPVWNEDHAAVWHMDAALTDSTASNAPAKDHGTADVAGKIGRARSFTDRNDHLQIPDSSRPDHPLDFSEGRVMTFSAWIYPEGQGVSQAGATALSGTILAKRYSTELDGVFDLNVQYQFAVHASGAAQATNLTERWRLRQSWGDDPKTNYSEYLTKTVFPRGDWYHVVIVSEDWHQPRLYVNGRKYEGRYFHEITDPAVTNAYVDADVTLGGYWAYYDEERKERRLMYGFHGRIDEVRMESVARSDDWIRAQYRSQTGAFIRFEKTSAPSEGVTGNTQEASPATASLTHTNNK